MRGSGDGRAGERMKSHVYVYMYVCMYTAYECYSREVRVGQISQRPCLTRSAGDRNACK